MNRGLSTEEFPARSDLREPSLAAEAIGRDLPIVFVLQWLASGGAEKQLLLTARYLAEAGHTCYILPLVPNERHPRIIRLLNDALNGGAKIVEPAKESLPRQFLKLVNFIGKLGRCVVWSWGARADLVCKLALVHRRQHPLVCSLRDANEERLKRYATAYRFLAKRADRYVSNTWLNAEMLEEIVPKSLPKCRVVYNCLEQDELGRSAVDLSRRPNRLEVVMLGNIQPHKKGYDYVVDLAERVREKDLPIHISVAGREDRRGWMQQHIASRHLASVLTYKGEASDPQAFLRSGHVFLLASRQEGTPNALLEAMNLGLPCISTRVGDVARFTSDKHNIRQVDIGDVAGILDVLKSFLADWSSAIRIGAAGRELCAQLFTPARMVSSTMQVLHELTVEKCQATRK